MRKMSYVMAAAGLMALASMPSISAEGNEAEGAGGPDVNPDANDVDTNETVGLGSAPTSDPEVESDDNNDDGESENGDGADDSDTDD